ncbi:MAG: TIGR02270 family protein [Acidobacteriota bacterium]
MRSREPLLTVVRQHAEESVGLRHVRSVLLRSPHAGLFALRRHDERIAAHLDGLAVAGPAGIEAAQAALDPPTAGGVFAAAVGALQGRDAPALTRLVSMAAQSPEAERGFLSALGWVSAEDLQGTVRALLGSKEPVHRAWALAACAMHRVDPGPALVQGVQDAAPGVQARAWRVAAELGRRDLAPLAQACVTPSADAVSVSRAAAAALTCWGLGHTEPVRQALLRPDPERALPPLDVHRLAVLAAPLDWGREQVRALAAQAEASLPIKRRMMRLAADLGDPQILPWLIQHMAQDRWARLAGEAFSQITGVDLAAQGLDRPAPDSEAPAPSDDPQDLDVALDEDDNLPWPDAAKVQAWWRDEGARFTPGQRHVFGQTPAHDHLMHRLQTGGQRQRGLAAQHLRLLNPAAGLFPIAAPAWRQQRWLTQGAH